MRKKLILSIIIIAALCTALAASTLQNSQNSNQIPAPPIGDIISDEQDSTSPTPQPTPLAPLNSGEVFLYGRIGMDFNSHIVYKETYNPTHIVFTDKATNQRYTASIYNEGIKGTDYTITLLDNRTYEIHGYWNGTAGNSPDRQTQDLYIQSIIGYAAHDLVFPD